MKIANVYCVIIGFANYPPDNHILFDYEKPTSEPHRVQVNNINPYLVDAVFVVISSRKQPISNAPLMNFGNMPNDGGHLLLTDQEKDELIKCEAGASKFIRPMLGSKEFINGISRWCIWLKDALPNEIKSMPHIIKRLELVKMTRLASTRDPTKKLAEVPALFGEIRHPDADYLLIPKTSSERRLYVPIGIMPSKVIPTECLIIPNVTLYHFGVLTSLMHMDWMRYVCGRLKSDYRYSASVVYNNFPWPVPTPVQKQKIEEKAQAVLDARAQFSNSTLADLYDPLTMPPVLLKAHQELDKVVDTAYRKERFTSERERVEFLFTRYEQLTAPLLPPEPIKKKRKKN